MKKSAGSFLIFLAVFLAVIVVIVGVGALIFLKWFRSDGDVGKIDLSNLFGQEDTTSSPSETDPPDTTSVPETEKVPQNADIAYTDKEVGDSDIHSGDLILVSGVYPYVFPEKNKAVTLYGKRSASYQLASSEIFLLEKVIRALNDWMDAFVEQGGSNDVIVTGGYRSYEDQKAKYDAYVETYGTDQTAVSAPGTSDHHTSLGVDLKVYRDGVMFTLSSDPSYEWIAKNAWRYGFVERYPASKKTTTGVTYSGAAYYRYVGTPHAEIMREKNFCLEEYVFFLREYPYDREHFLFTAEDGTEYEIYAVSPTGASTVPVPSDRPYSLSGDNIDGLIVTFAR